LLISPSLPLLALRPAIISHQGSFPFQTSLSYNPRNLRKIFSSYISNLLIQDIPSDTVQVRIIPFSN
jgi:hypothetical protein